MERKCETNGKQRGRVKKRRKREKEEMEENRGKWEKEGNLINREKGGTSGRISGAQGPGQILQVSNIHSVILQG